ncbi:fatty acyl-CoA reductase wat-like [Ischnura elegans]|uniref:fatty acyl-CoA reductase wat-like n=1 Tax=Ischnura elegans TaxID=197161 RepID=UPI001ED87AD4|nr:fatty acyl-CoA reductase wat-like [Ischnura elegans]XP_046383569.1 fatty acyl-CoA reductase wat-like [Ischnura elegans]XP_046383570.1 fatty acyl-CoA reductase wat-like [Ischnura elegans]
MEMGLGQGGNTAGADVVADYDSSAVMPEDGPPVEGEAAVVRSPIQEFFNGKNVFVTGGTGFMGKVLIEKLLRSCPDTNRIYVLMRSKKGKDIGRRFDEIFDDPLFDKLRSQRPKFTEKLTPINGDCLLPGLGLSISDRELLCQKVGVVFHAAATVRFDEKLRQAVGINVHGTRDLLDLCREMRQLKSVVHISTAYSNCNRKQIEERFYVPPLNYTNILQCVECLDDSILEAMTPLMLGKWPNTYTFTKAITEDMIRTYAKDIPITIFRPAIIIATWREPVSGWIDNLYGPTGVVVGAGTGVLRTLHCDKNIVADMVPVDMTVAALIASAWATAKEYQNLKPIIPIDAKVTAPSYILPSESKSEEEENIINARTKDESKEETKEKDVKIYNYVSSVQRPITWGEFMNLNIKYGMRTPSMRSIWYYTLTLNKSLFIHNLYVLFLHLLPALIVDICGYAIGKRPKLLKIYQKINKFSKVISYFSTQCWKFDNANVVDLWNRLDPMDKSLFQFDMNEMDWDSYFQKHILGLRIYLVKDDLSTLPEAKKRWRRFYYMHRLIQCVFGVLVIRCLWFAVSTVATYVY